MSPRWIRRIVIVVFVAGIAGMIAGSVADNNGVAITFGLVTAAAAVGLILVTSVAPPDAFRSGRSGPRPLGPDQPISSASGAERESQRRLFL